MANFLNLPLEIRLLIYGYIYSTGEHHLLLHLELSKIYLTEVPKHRGLLMVSRQCYNEVIDLHRESLTHLVIHCARFNMNNPYSRRKDSVEPYTKMFHRTLDLLGFNERFVHTTEALRKISLPSFITAKDFRSTWLSALPDLRTIEFVSCDVSLRDIHPPTALHKSGRPHHELNRGGHYYNLPREVNVGAECATRLFVPAWHLMRAKMTWDRWSDFDESHISLYASPYVSSYRWKAEPLPRHIRVLWTTKVEWRKKPVNLSDEHANIVYRSPEVFPRCHSVDFKYTYDCEEGEVVDLQILAQTPCGIEGCPRENDEQDFSNYLGIYGEMLLKQRRIPKV